MCGDDSAKHKVLGRRLNGSQGLNPSGKIGITTTICKCTRCNLIYSNPQPIPLDISDHYGVPPEAYWKKEYFQIDPNYFAGEIQTLKNLLPILPKMKSLDVGAGLGKQMIALKNAGFDAFGFEPSSPFFERAINEMKIPQDKLRLGMIEDVDYPSEHFDFISFGAVLEHLYDPSASIRKALGWLKPNGIIHIEVPSSKWLIGKLINVYYQIRLKDFVGNLSPMHTPFHLHEFGIDSFLLNGQMSGYKIVNYQFHVCQTFMPKPLDPLFRAIMEKTNTGMQLTVWLQRIGI
jgi:SAM-dependent methyltransferase